MSRIGFLQIVIPHEKGVSVQFENRTLTVTGQKGSLSTELPAKLDMNITRSSDTGKEIIELSPVVENKRNTSKLDNSLHGLYRSLLENMIVGASEGFSRKLQIFGVGYKAELDGKDIILSMGYSHPVRLNTPPDLSISVESQNTIIVSGLKKDAVGEFSAKIRAVRPPEPYKGKGIFYAGEQFPRKAGKTGKK
jgi:large subunit ribosomal protein L6